MSTLQTALQFKEEGNKLLKAGGDLSQVISHYTKGVNAIKNSTPLDSDQKKVLIDLYNNRSHVYSMMASYYRAVQDADAALKIDQENVKSMLRFVRAAIRINMFLAAIDKCEKAESLLMEKLNNASILDKDIELFRELKEKAKIGQEKYEKFMQVFRLLEEKDKNSQIKEILDTIQDDISLVCDHHGESFLNYASRSGNMEIVKYLVEEKKVFIDMQNYRGACALYYAAFSGFPEIAEYLMSLRADPTHPSTFSGKKPHEVCKSEDLRKKMTQYYTTFEAIKKDPFYNFKYRIGEYWRENLFYFRHPNSEGYFQGFQLSPKARDIVANSDIQELLKVVLEKRSEYDSFFTDRKYPAENECLLCNEIVENCAKCKFCKKVNLCTKCENSSDKIIIMMKQIHQNNCRSGMYF